MRGGAIGTKGDRRAGSGSSGACLCKPVRSRKECTVAEATSTADPRMRLSIIAPPARGRGFSTLLRAGCSVGGGRVEKGNGGLRVDKAIFRREVDWETCCAEVDVAVGAMPRKGSCSDAWVGAL